MLRHVVNFGLLFSFLTLAVTGVLSFLRPFSIVTTRTHVVFGLATLILVGLHLGGRLGYFKKQVSKPSRNSAPRPLLIAIIAVWLILLRVSFTGKAPASLVVDQSYEAKHRAEIVRSSSMTGVTQPTSSEMLLARAPTDGANVAVSLSIRFGDGLEDKLPSIAVWTETTAGSMIETLYLDPSIAYSDKPEWRGAITPRHHIVPLWRHRYSLVSGVDPSGKIDAMTGATQSHSFSLDKYLNIGEDSSFVLCVEVNTAKDTNETYQDLQIGQPSLLYTALIDLDAEQRYALLELTGHGGSAEKSGAIQYDLDGHTSAKQLIDLLLAKSTPSKQERP